MRVVYISILPLAVFTFGLRATPNPKSDYWQIIASASDIHVINSNDLKKYLPDLESSIKKEYYYYNVPVMATIKGATATNVKIMEYLEQDFIDHIKSLPDNVRLIIFIKNLYTKYRNTGTDEFNNLFVSKHRGGIIIYTDAIYEEITNEVANQQTILKEKLYEYFKKDESMDSKIGLLINELTDRQRELVVFDELLMMGKEAVPYIILRMDDYRELPIKYARLINDSPDAWEAWVQYGPHLVIDMLEIILSELTVTNFGFLSAGDNTNEERQRTLNGWRIYLYYHYVANELNKNNE